MKLIKEFYYKEINISSNLLMNKNLFKIFFNLRNPFVLNKNNFRIIF